MRNTAALRRPSAAMLAQVSSIPAPVGGWDTISPLAEMPPNRAVLLDNWICRPGYLEIRRGQNVWTTGNGTSTTSVESLMVYNGTSANKMFSAAGTKIYDSSSSGAASSVVTGLTNARWQYTNFTDSASNHYIVCVNGADTPQKFDGTSWTNFAPTGVTGTSIIQIGSHKGRLWMVTTGTTIAYYMAVGAVTGAATAFDLGPYMKRGGFLNAIATWSVDTRQTVDDYIAFISSRGDVIVYQGTDPSSSTTWALVGVYTLGPPIGRRCFLRIAGDLLIITLDGVLPMSQMLSTDRAAANRVSLTSIIMNAMNISTQSFASNFGWEMLEYPTRTIAILNIPTTVNSVAQQYVMNTLTGAWSRWIGINANCWAVYNDLVYVGANNGNVYQADQDSADDTTPITASVQTAFNYFGTRGRLKRITMVRPILTTDGVITPGVGVNMDFGAGAAVSNPSSSGNAGALWDQALWDVAVWPQNSATTANWFAIGGIGQCASLVTSVISNHTGAANGVLLQLNGWDVAMEMGGVI